MAAKSNGTIVLIVSSFQHLYVDIAQGPKYSQVQEVKSIEIQVKTVESFIRQRACADVEC